jgi:hypothetical protein
MVQGWFESCVNCLRVVFSRKKDVSSDIAVDLNRGGGEIRDRMDTVVILSLKQPA